MNKLDLTDHDKVPDALLTIQENQDLKERVAQLDAVLWEIRNGLNQYEASHNNGDGGKTIGLARIRHALNSVDMSGAAHTALIAELCEALNVAYHFMETLETQMDMDFKGIKDNIIGSALAKAKGERKEA